MIEPIRFRVTVPLSPADAFLLFTERMTEWWPLPTHSLGQDRATRVEFEPFAGGRIVEHTRDGEEHVWGEVLIAEPPHRIVFTWHPGLDADTEVEVTFRACHPERSEGPGGAGGALDETPGRPGPSLTLGMTEVTLEHRRWEALGAMAEEARIGYANGWPYVFVQRFTAAAQGELS
jgi:uncharacterized protein YndB with AHSA1/START domain